MKKFIFLLLSITILFSCKDEKDPIQQLCEKAIKSHHTNSGLDDFYFIDSFKPYKQLNISLEEFDEMCEDNLLAFRKLIDEIIEPIQHNIDNGLECGDLLLLGCEELIIHYNEIMLEFENSIEIVKSKYTPVNYKIEYKNIAVSNGDILRDFENVAYLNSDFEVLLPVSFAISKDITTRSAADYSFLVRDIALRQVKKQIHVLH